ncbi:MAG: hypothetical protein LBB82_07215 [Treponema sp.]|jgi:hypothetical protein|nr:hypothetical protein [Treponema sp.]
MRKASSLTLRLGIFFYDILRVFFLLALLAGVTGDPSGPGGMFQGAPDGLRFPYMVYAAPNALFSIMSFFLLIRSGESKAFVPLYITGKVISVTALVSWALFAFLKLRGFPPFMLLLFFLGAADLTTVAGTALLNAASPAAGAAEWPVQTTDREGEK